jgi:hypothetical protein
MDAISKTAMTSMKSDFGPYLDGAAMPTEVIRIGVNHTDAVYVMEVPFNGAGDTTSPEAMRVVKQMNDWYFTDYNTGGKTVISIGASANLIDEALKPFCEICANVTALNGFTPAYSSAATAGESIFGEHWLKFNTVERETITKHMLKTYDGFNANYVMKMIADHCGSGPMYFDHPATRLSTLQIDKLTPKTHKIGFSKDGERFDRRSFLGTHIGHATSDKNADWTAWVYSSHLSAGSDKIDGSGGELIETDHKKIVDAEVDAIPMNLRWIIGKYRGGYTGIDGVQQFQISLGSTIAVV